MDLGLNMELCLSLQIDRKLRLIIIRTIITAIIQINSQIYPPFLIIS